MIIQTFRQRVIEVEAVHFNRSELAEQILQWIKTSGTHAIVFTKRTQQTSIVIDTPIGDICAVLGDWVVRDARGEFHVCGPTVFNVIYEQVYAPTEHIDEVDANVDDAKTPEVTRRSTINHNDERSNDRTLQAHRDCAGCGVCKTCVRVELARVGFKISYE